ncbi:FecR family protein [Chitinophaga tropicalis]|uniref:DUF4974 domain-containing protein n=1 Tax=Chitinophaga tropicalis TaxID=2683588 RepID=A0A7K1U0A1_9BACT|nr:FecR family protein [Chitinophaga tropicalis]MVT07797.1 DUF4974 domain-containing protein [Chitinophaga tropicalis]
MTREQLSVLTRKYLDGTANAEEKTLLEKWYHSFEGEELVAELPEGVDEGMLETRLKEKIDRERNIRKGLLVQMRRYRVAAAICLLVATGLLAIILQGRKVYATGHQPRFAMLPDGSKVWLNADTRLVYTDYPLLHERSLSLTGEAYFDVVRDPQKPFIIHSGSMTTRVLGTAFNIKAYPGEPFYVTVTSGKIRLEDKKTRTITFLTPDRQLKYNNQNRPVVAQVKAAAAYAWTRGQLEFYDQSFVQIARTIKRNYNIEVVFASESLQHCMFTASFEKETPVSRVVDLLCRINNASYTFNADSSVVTVSGKGCP